MAFRQNGTPAISEAMRPLASGLYPEPSSQTAEFVETKNIAEPASVQVAARKSVVFLRSIERNPTPIKIAIPKATIAAKFPLRAGTMERRPNVVSYRVV